MGAREATRKSSGISECELIIINLLSRVMRTPGSRRPSARVSGLPVCFTESFRALKTAFQSLQKAKKAFRPPKKRLLLLSTSQTKSVDDLDLPDSVSTQRRAPIAFSPTGPTFCAQVVLAIRRAESPVAPELAPTRTRAFGSVRLLHADCIAL
jgi:hypothetical protein